jgi:phosphoketolase
MEDARLQARTYARDYGEDAPNVSEWCWSPEADVAP